MIMISKIIMITSNKAGKINNYQKRSNTLSNKSSRNRQ